ncbi:heavy-metal-associated domain-containing protein [Belliella sp. R4-6]|uniref:Heavy-metal-associated domain-containing protein n=1 Tax=Belliella alkalica TaxID=1730871 RepID=A0ABS9VDF1_9BACT|nr:heavy metal-associated domain-containing protein [Belliella alkalica]MCH7414467.1 heavy-metal-associated domain-containing protein [Belliella alkalica]
MFKRIIIGCLVIFAALVVTLAVHIYLVTQPKNNGMPNMTMSRIDFVTQLDSLEAINVKNHTSQLDGVKDVRVNVKAGHMVCLYDRNKQAPQDIIESISKDFYLEASLYQPSDEMLAQSCPAINKSSLTYKLGAFFQRTFEN